MGKSQTETSGSRFSVKTKCLRLKHCLLYNFFALVLQACKLPLGIMGE